MSLQPAYRDAFATNLRQLNAQDRDFISPDEVAAAGMFFLSPAAAVITGEALDVAAGANVHWNS
jgi:enoyl-[acyl-carrier-protein] reductase (NADH)